MQEDYRVCLQNEPTTANNLKAGGVSATMYPSPQHPIKSGCSTSSSITELLTALCDSSLAGVSWKRRALGGVSREAFHKALKKRAYGTLLSKLFQYGVKAPATPGLSSPPRNRVLMICFDLRVAGCREEAERLEELLETLPEGAASGLSELDSVLELLVHLAGSSPPPPPSFSRDYMRRERPVLRRPAPWPYQSTELQRLEARAWGLVCAEEWASVEHLCGTRRLMEAQPGAGLMAVKTKMDTEERFEKETRLTLFGALQHTRTSDLDIRLDLPPVPSNVDITGLTIRVPPCLDQSDDEGFQSASNLTPDSQSEASPGPEVDVWEALRTFEPGVRRCWESVGWPPGRRESLYLSESGREAFDQLYRLWEGEMRVVSGSVPTPLLPLPVDTQGELVADLLNVLMGVASTTFPLNQSVQFDVRPGVCVSGASPESVSRLLGELAQYGTYYLRLSRFSLQSPEKKGLVFQAFTGGLRKYLHHYRACVLSTPPRLSLLTIGFLFRKVGQQLRYLSELCRVDGPLGGDRAAFPVGVKLLSHLYNEVQNNCSNENYPVLLSLLKSSCEPYTRFVSDWVYSGVFRDVYGEFMIQVNEEYLSFRDKHFWVHGYTLISKDVEESVPIFLRHIANDVYVCGKTINLLKICCPQHYICLSELPVPRIAVTFSLQEVEGIERDCAMYRGRMERIAKHSAVSREVQAQRAEEARQELINQVRASAAKTLESIRGRQVSQRLAEEARKRERFRELKQHLEQEQEWRSAAKKKQEEDDFGFARELRDREKRLQALEEQLEQRARKELIAQYSHLSEEAARKERRALWRAQRTRLDEARSHFFENDRRELRAILEKHPLGQEGHPASPPQHPSALEIPSEPLEETKPEKPEESEESRMADAAAFISGDFLPESQNPDDTKQDEMGADIPEACPTAQLLDYDFSAPFSPLEGIAGRKSLARLRPSCGSAVLQPDVLHERSSIFRSPAGEKVLPIHGRVSTSNPSLGPGAPEEPPNASRTNGLPTQDATLLGQGDASALVEQDKVAEPQEGAAVKGEDDAHALPPEKLGSLSNCKTICAVEAPSNLNSARSSRSPTAHPSYSHIEIGKHVSDVKAPQPSPNVHGHASDANIKVGGNVSEFFSPLPARNLHGHAYDANIKVGGNVSEFFSPLPARNLHGHASDANIRVGENVSDFVDLLPARNPHGHASDANIGVGENVSDFVGLLPARNLHGHASDANIKVGGNVSEFFSPLPARNLHGHASDANIRVGENVSDFVDLLPARNPHGHASDANIEVGGNVSEFFLPPPARNLHGHASDANIKVGENVSDFVDSLPARNLHGHASDANIEVGGNVSEFFLPPPARNLHGHASDANIKVGGNVSEFFSPVPVRNLHGHASDANIKVGENVSDFVDSLPARNLHGHASDANIKVGGNISEFFSPPPARNLHGHASDANIKVGAFVSDVSEAKPRWSKHGHASDSTLQVGCVVSGSPPVSTPSPASARGHVSDSSLGGGCVVTPSNPLPSPPPGSQYGHSSDSALGVRCVVMGAAPPASAPGEEPGNRLEADMKVDHSKDVTAGESETHEEQMWSAGFDLSPGEKSEREYLLALSAQYQVEHYEDCYSLMASSPECQLLKHVARGPRGPRGLPALRHAADATSPRLSEMVSLPVLIKHSVTAPLITHVSLVNKAVVDYFFVELGVERHFEALRHFLLMDDGEFAQSLSDRLFEKMGSGQTPGELLTPLVLNSILSKALQYSLHGDTPLAANFTFALRFLPDTFHPHAPDSLNCLELRYKVAWPLNIIITDSCMNKYNRLFSFQLQLKHMVWSLRDVWFHLKRTAVVKGAGRSVQFRQLQLYRHEMQHFVKVIQGYIANQILQVSWSEFTAKMAAACDLDAIHRTHADYLNRAIFRALLTEKAAPVMNIIHSIFSLILKFRAQLIALPWASQQGEAMHPSFIAMQQSYNTFKYYSHFLFKVVTKLVNRGYQPHLEDFLLRINFNNYYKDS